MKNRYERLTKEEKKQVYKDFRNESEKNDKYAGVLNRMLVCGTLGFIYGVVSIISDIFLLHAAVWAYLVDAIVIIFTFYLIFQRNAIKKGVLNNYIIQKEAAEKAAAEKAAKPKKRKHVSKNAKANKTAKKATKKADK